MTDRLRFKIAIKFAVPRTALAVRGALYMIEQVADASGRVKIGITSQTGLPGRASTNQTGSPYEQRVVTLCIFYDREAAKDVEQEVKRRRRASVRRGGTEWVGASRHELVGDVCPIARELQRAQLLANANRGTVVVLDAPRARRFYGVVLLDIVDGELVDYREESVSPPPDAPPSEVTLWARVREFLRISARNG